MINILLESVLDIHHDAKNTDIEYKDEATDMEDEALVGKEDLVSRKKPGQGYL